MESGIKQEGGGLQPVIDIYYSVFKMAISECNVAEILQLFWMDTGYQN